MRIVLCILLSTLGLIFLGISCKNNRKTANTPILSQENNVAQQQLPLAPMVPNYNDPIGQPIVERPQPAIEEVVPVDHGLGRIDDPLPKGPIKTPTKDGFVIRHTDGVVVTKEGDMITTTSPDKKEVLYIPAQF